MRVLLSLLLLRAGHRVDSRYLAETMWPERDPTLSANALQALVSRLRRTLGPGARIDGNGAGYLLETDPGEVDLHEFEDLADRGRERLTAGSPEEAERLLRRARDLWRGPVLPDLTARDLAGETVLRLTERHRSVLEDHLLAGLRLGRHEDVLPEAEALAGAEPYRERPAEILIRALAGTGRVADALEVYDILRARLAEDLGMDPSPNMQDLHLRLLRNELAAPVQDPVRRAALLRVPTSLTSFVPRDRELEATVALLRSDRLVTLTGPGGAGKTRLAIEAVGVLADRAPEHVADGGWFVELTPLRAGDDPSETLAAALELREQSMLRTPTATPQTLTVERVTAFLGGRDVLLVLDNCEHLLDDVAPFVGLLLARCPRLRVLATSREPLGVPGERLVPVPPLALPEPGVDAFEVGAYPAVTLFTERARAVRPDFTITSDNVEHVVRVVRELDGMPLALELAAARLRSMSLAQLAGRLRDRFRLLTGTGRTVLPRHRTLRAVVDWSWELLDTAERRLLRRLSVFPGGATLEAVECVGADPGGHGVDGRDLWTTLFALVDKSLVVVENVESDLAPPRYRLLETVRAYAEERLVAAEEASRVRDTHARYVCDLWRAADLELRGGRQREWLLRLGAEADNFGVAVRWAIEVGDAHLALDLIGYGQWYWILESDWQPFSRWVDEVLSAFGDRFPRGRATTHACCLFQRVMVGEENRDTALRRFQEIEGVLATEGERPEDHHVLVHGVFYMAMLEEDLGPYHQRLRAALEHSDPWIRAMVGALLAVLETIRGRVGLSREYAEASLAGFRALGDVWGRCQALAQVADARRYDDGERVLRLLDESTHLAVEGGLTGMASNLRLRRAQVRIDLGEFAAAEEELRVLERESRLPGVEAGVLHHMVRIQLLRERGRADEAVDLIVHTQKDVAALGGFVPFYLEPGWWALAATVYHGVGDTENTRRAIGRSWWLGRTMLGLVAGEVLDVMALAEEDPRRAATLLGYAVALRGAEDVVTPYVVRTGARVRRALGEECDALLARARRTDPRRVREVVDEWWADHRPAQDLDPSEGASWSSQVRRR